MLDLQKLNHLWELDDGYYIDITNAMTYRLMVYVRTRQSVLELAEKYGWEKTVEYLKNSDELNAVYFLSVAEHLQRTNFGDIGIADYDRFFAELPESWTADFVNVVLARIDYIENGGDRNYEFWETSKKPRFKTVDGKEIKKCLTAKN